MPYAATRTENDNIAVTYKGNLVYTLVRGEQGWRVITNHAARKSSRSTHNTARQAARCFLKGDVLSEIARIGGEIAIDHVTTRFEETDFETIWGWVTIDGQQSGTDVEKFPCHLNATSFCFCTRKEGSLETDRIAMEAAMAWCHDQLGRKRKRWSVFGSGIWFANEVDAAAFKLRWC